MILRAAQYKGQAQRSRYIVSQFKNDHIPMMIFSYLWNSSQASKRIRELNSKAKEIIRNDFITEFPGLFNEVEETYPSPLKDIFFDDFTDFNFFEYKDVHVHELDIYDNGVYVNGFEAYYIVDGDIMKYALHFRST